MKRKQVWRFYCEFCGKGSCSGGGMAIHEKHCTMNPNRECRFCKAGSDWGMEQLPIADLIATLGDGRKEGMDRLREAATNCPACILAGIRQSGLREREENAYRDGEGYLIGAGEEDGGWWSFDFKKEAETFWSEVNSEAREREDRANYSYYCTHEAF